MSAQYPLVEAMAPGSLKPRLTFSGQVVKFGRELLTRIMYGARIALFVGFTASFAGCTLGALLGVLSAYWGGTVELLLERLMDILLAFPQLILALAIASV